MAITLSVAWTMQFWGRTNNFDDPCQSSPRGSVGIKLIRTWQPRPFQTASRIDYVQSASPTWLHIIHETKPWMTKATHNRQDSEHSGSPKQKKGKSPAQGEHNCGLKLGNSCIPKIAHFGWQLLNIPGRKIFGMEPLNFGHQTRLCQSPSIPIGGHNLAPGGFRYFFPQAAIPVFAGWNPGILMFGCHPSIVGFEKASQFTSNFTPHVPRSGCQTAPSACFGPKLESQKLLIQQRCTINRSTIPRQTGNPGFRQPWFIAKLHLGLFTILIPKSSDFSPFFLQKVSRISVINSQFLSNSKSSLLIIWIRIKTMLLDGTCTSGSQVHTKVDGKKIPIPQKKRKKKWCHL